MTNMNQIIRRVAAAGTVMVLVGSLAACEGTRHQLLDAATPDLISPSTATSSDAADALRVGALARVRNITAGGEGAWMLGGLLTDEWKSSDTFSQRNETDQRTVQESNANVQSMYREIHRVRNTAREAINALKQYKPAPAWGIGQMYFAIALAEVELAESFCNGIPLSDASTGSIVYSAPQTNAAIYALAKAHLDTALANATPATDAGAVAVKNSALILQARVLVELGQFSAAAAAVTGIPTSFSNLVTTYSLTSGDNQIWSLNNSAKRWTVGDSMDASGVIGNAIPFASAGDPRLKVTGTTLGTSSLGRGFDGSTNFIVQNNWGRSDATNIVSGLDARLIEAEAALNANDINGMMTILNALRAAPPQIGINAATAVTPTAMTALATPATQTAAVDLFFREKAFWTFGRGQRLGDLRRLVRVYGRTQDKVFPVGTFFKGGPYGTDTNFPVTTDEYNNPNFTGCIDRKS